MPIDMKNVEWDTQVQNPIAPEPKAIDMKNIEWDDEASQDRGWAGKFADGAKKFAEITKNPLTSIGEYVKKEWIDADKEKKVDRDTLYAIESLAKIDTRLLGDATPEQKEQYLLNVSKVLGEKGYKLAEVESGDKKEFVALDAEGNQKEITNNFFNSLVDGLWADKYETAGAVMGAKKGYELTKYVPNKLARLGGALVGGAIGAMGGTAVDTAEATLRTGQEFNVEDFFNELNKSAALDATATVVGGAVLKGTGAVLKGAKKTVEPFIDYAKNNNIDGAKSQLLKDIGVDETEAKDALERAKGTYKEVEEYAKDGLLSDASKKQEELLAVAAQDKKFGKKIIHDIVLDDVDAALNVSKQVDARTKNLIKSFEDVAIDGTEVKRAVEGYEKQVGENYGKMRDTFKEAFANVDYAFDLKALKTDEIMRSTVNEIVNQFDKEVAKNLLMKVEKIVGDESGITRNFDNLIELRQSVNDFYSRASKSMKHDSKEAFSQLKKNIDTELYSAIDKNIPQEMQKPLKDMFDDAIAKYKEMYAIKDTKLYKTLMKEGKSAEARMNALIKHTADDEMEFATLLKKLPSEHQEKIENSITKAVLDKNLFGASGELQAIDYNKAVTTLGKLEDFMVTQSGKESVALIKDMATKYGDDLELLQAASQAGVETGAGIAATVGGRIRYKLAKKSFDKITRLLPTDDGRRLAIYHNIAEALKKSRTPMDMAKRVAGSAEVPKSDKADLLEWVRDFNRANSVKNEQEAQKLLAEVEAKEALRAAKEAEAKAIMEDFANVDKAEIAAVQKLSGSKLLNENAYTADDVKRYLDAKSKIDPKRLDSTITFIKYPLQTAEAKISKLLANSADEVATAIDETTLKVLQYDIKQGKLRNDKLQDAYKNLMKLYDAKAAQKTPQQILQGKEAELSDVLRKAEFSKSIDATDEVSEHMSKAKMLQDEIEQIKSSLPNPNAEIRTSKPLSSQAQAAKDIADLNYHDNEDEAAKAVKDLFKKNSSEEKRFKNMTDEDIAEYERIHAKDVEPKQKDNDAYDEDGELIPFANPHIGSGLVAGGGNGLEYDENGNIVGFDVDGFVGGFLAGVIGSKAGATALKRVNPKLYNNILGVSKEFPNMATSNPKLLAQIYKSAPSAKGQALTFVGEKAMKADVAKLDDAMKMAEDGAKEADIWRSTGWFKGDDGKWRFEVDDSGAKVLTKKELLTATKQMLDTGDAMQIPKKMPSMSKSISKEYKDSQGFYSVLEKTIDEKVGGRIDSASLSKMLDNNGVKQDELEWSGLKELMEKNERLTKEEIEETISENRLVVEVVEKSDKTKYEKYKLESGKDYRELLFTMPSKIDNDIKIIKADDGYYYAEKAPYDGSNVITSAKSQAGVTKALQAGSYKSSHWDENNILVFTRVDDRTIDGKDTLFIEELQSDWHQEGRKKGYGKKIPDAPFKKNWHELGLKRMVQEAVANDYDKIAWTTGKQQADRYSLEQTVDTVVYNKDARVIQATNGGKEVFFKMVSSEKDIEDIMGKELTIKLLDKKNTTTDSVHVLQGEELKFGGDGMKAFYDEIVPNTAKKLFKKYGVKPKIEELDDVEQMVWSVDITPQMKDEIRKYGQPLYAVGGAVGVHEATKGEDK